MAGIKAPLQDIMTRLATLTVVNRDAQTVPLFVRVWNNQLQFEKEGKLEAYPKPAAFVEVISPAVYETIGQGFRSSDISFRVHLVHEYMNAEGTFEQDLEIFDLRDKTVALLTKFTPTACGPLTAVTEEQDNEHDNLYHYVIDFVANFTDSKGSPLDEGRGDYIPSEPPLSLEIDITKEVGGGAVVEKRTFTINKNSI